MNMSFSLTTPQFRARTKTVTRRLGWRNLKPGEQFVGVVKGMGLKKGDKVERLGKAICVSNRTEPLNLISEEDCVKEGFPHFTPEQFVQMFCKHNGCQPNQEISRIEFDYVEPNLDDIKPEPFEPGEK